MRIYNIDYHRETKNFLKCLFIVLPIALLLGWLYGFLSKIIGLSLSILYIPIAFLIAHYIRIIGKGLTKKFSILAAVLMVLCILMGDATSIFGENVLAKLFSIQGFQTFLRFEVLHLSSDLNSLISLLIRIYAINEAYQRAII